MRTGRDECENLCLPFIYRKPRKVSCMAFVYNLAGECFSDIPAVESKGAVRAVARTLICGQIPRNFM